MSTHTTTETWLDNGDTTCDVDGCRQPADIIADTWDTERFCANHTHEAAAIPARHHPFPGWYRITDIREHNLGLLLTVHPI